jgi:hypothetical protein
MMEIDQKTIAELLQLGGQYAIPAAALLRALYSGWKGKFPEGFGQITAASLFAGLTAVTDNQQADLGSIITDILGNTVFMVGLLSFIMLYLLRQPNRGLIVDAVVGAFIGVVAWALWYYVLRNDLSLGSLLETLGVQPDSPFIGLADLISWPAAAGAGALIFVLLRFALRQIGRVVRLATTLLTIGIILAVIAGGLYLATQAGLITLG